MLPKTLWCSSGPWYRAARNHLIFLRRDSSEREDKGKREREGERQRTKEGWRAKKK